MNEVNVKLNDILHSTTCKQCWMMFMGNVHILQNVSNKFFENLIFNYSSLFSWYILDFIPA